MQTQVIGTAQQRQMIAGRQELATVELVLESWQVGAVTLHRVRGGSYSSRDYAAAAVAIRNAKRELAHPTNAAAWLI